MFVPFCSFRHLLSHFRSPFLSDHYHNRIHPHRLSPSITSLFLCVHLQVDISIAVIIHIVKLCFMNFFNAEIEKEKLCSYEDVEGGGAGGASAGGGSSSGVSASLTPAIWEKTIPYDGENFHLEYMDLDEFLLENGIPVTMEEEEQQQKSTPSVTGKGKLIPQVAATATTPTTTTPTTTATTPPAAAACVSASASSTSASSATSVVNPDPEKTVTTLQPAKLEEDEGEEEDGQALDASPEETGAEVDLKEKGTGEILDITSLMSVLKSFTMMEL